jgi:hypothetical protein
MFSVRSAVNNNRTGFSVRCPGGDYITRITPALSQYTRVEAGSNTSTVTLRVVGGEEKESLKTETVKYDHESQGTRTRERLPGEGHQRIYKTDPSCRQSGRPTKTRP